MKARITKDGTLIITPESELEDFVLQSWCKTEDQSWVFESYNEEQ